MASVTLDQRVRKWQKSTQATLQISAGDGFFLPAVISEGMMMSVGGMMMSARGMMLPVGR